ncbi:LOW QUALITY PROTEIN: partner of Y14 and mago [Halyomorpha halys]|uniref:LOW QUALITY PROTEIN: partner of Y14 and mago n=1 Tax=Halyomorpha halys TaxID=286706 RepID=UPI0006D4D52D|nr:LOW QUALITY PROTEIN: partner of Y14 and mago [Halyomorpha halys]
MASIVNTDSGRVIAATQRPDGSWRKERRVKDGYTPQEEVPLYESKGKQWASSKPAYPPGLDPKLIKEGEVKKKKKKGSGSGQAQQPQRAPLAEVKSTPDIAPVRAEEKWETVDGKGRGNKGAKKDNVKEIVIKKIQPEIPKAPPVQQEPAKKLRNLKKKLKEIEQLEARIKSKELKNPDLSLDQLSKVARKSEIEDAIEALELEISSLNIAS